MAVLTIAIIDEMLVLNTDCMVKVFYVVLIGISCYLNCCSYYVCCAFVWYLKEMSKRPAACEVPHISARPAKSPAYATLVRVADSNSIAFLVASVASSLVVCISLYLFTIQEGGVPEHAQMVFFVLLTVGVGSSAVICFLSRYFLARLLDVWREDAVIEIESLIAQNPDRTTELLQAIDAVCDGKGAEPVSWEEAVLALLSLALNVLNCLQVFGVLESASG